MSFAQFSSGKFQKGLEGESSNFFSVKIVEDVVDEFIGGCKSKTDEGILEFDGVNDPTRVAVEDVKGTFDLPHLVDRD